MSDRGPAVTHGEPRPGEEGSDAEDDLGAHYVTVNPGGSGMHDEQLFSDEDDDEEEERGVLREPDIRHRRDPPPRHLRTNQQQFAGEDAYEDTAFVAQSRRRRGPTHAQMNMQAMRDGERHTRGSAYQYDEEYMREIRKENLAKDMYKDPDVAKRLRKFERLIIEDDKLILTPKRPAEVESQKNDSGNE